MEISFIIPIYNTCKEKMQRCFDTISMVKELEYEVLLIDDGSDNDVKKFCEQYIKIHPEFCYYYQAHAGVSAARNYGIEKALGKYIAFIDSDDYILPKLYNRTLILKKFDLMIFDMEYDMGDRGIKYRSVIPDKETGIYGRMVLFEAINEKSGAGAPVAKLFRRELLINNNIRFDIEMQSGEDADFIMQVMLVIDSFIYKAVSIYRYVYTFTTGRKRIMGNSQRAVYSIGKGFLKKSDVIIKLGMNNDLQESYLKQMSQQVIKSLMCVSGQLEIHKMMNNGLKIQIAEVLHMINKKDFSPISIYAIRYLLLAGGHWRIIALYERMRMAWADFKFKYRRKW